MKIYLVGGAVRDKLLGRTPKDKDYVVVGATVPQFLSAFPGAQPVGKNFPVFLHEGCEYAFARLEKKVAIGHDGFDIISDPTVTLEQDLERRDLTINAMAIDEVVGRVIDPFGGQVDLLHHQVLRHVGPAFVEDPLRVFRLARFAARYGFDVVPATIAIAKSILPIEIVALSEERVCQEFRDGIGHSPWPRHFIEVLEQTGALDLWMPEISRLRSVPAGPVLHHAEGDALTHTLMVVDEAVKLGGTELEVTAALLHDLGKGTTPEAEWPRHIAHEQRGVPEIERLAQRLRLPVELTRAAILASVEHLRVHRYLEMKPTKQVDLVTKADRNPLRSEGLALVAEADARGRTHEGPPKTAGPQALRVAAIAARAIKARNLAIPEGLKDEKIGEFIRKQRAFAVKEALKGTNGTLLE